MTAEPHVKSRRVYRKVEIGQLMNSVQNGTAHKCIIVGTNQVLLPKIANEIGVVTQHGKLMSATSASQIEVPVQVLTALNPSTASC